MRNDATTLNGNDNVISFLSSDGGSGDGGDATTMVLFYVMTFNIVATFSYEASLDGEVLFPNDDFEEVE